MSTRAASVARQRAGLPVVPTAGEAVAAARALEQWGHDRGWRGTDPYDGLNATRLSRLLGRSPLTRRVLTQAVKRSPVDLRPALGIPSGLSAATLALVISAYARNGFLEPEPARAKLTRRLEQLKSLRCTTFAEPCWGYHFDVQTRVFFYPRSQPNTIATAFAGLALLDAHEFAGASGALELAAGVGEFFMRHVPQTDSDVGAYFGYLPGDRTPIHNANMLVAALLARLAALLDRPELGRAASSALLYTTERQRADGSWPYGELPHLSWTDGFHTGYVLDCLLTCLQAGIADGGADAAWRRGIHFYATALIERDGTPRYTPGGRYPVDGQCAAQAIQTLARGAQREPELGARSWDVLRYCLRRLAQGDGAFVFQRDRLWTNRATHPRWVEAPMLLALTHLISQES